MTRMQAHPSEQVIGRYRKDLGMDRRYRMARLILDPWPEPRRKREEPEEEPFWQVLGVWLLLCASLYVLVAVGSAMYTPEPQHAAPVVEPLVR